MISDLIVRMLKKNGKERMTIEEIRQHPWIRNSVWAIYFQKGFQNWILPKEDDGEVIAGLRKLGIDPGGIEEGSQEGVVRRILMKQEHIRRAASPDMLGTGTRYGFSAAELALPRATRGTAGMGEGGHKVSLLENFKHHTGVVLAKRARGRVAMRSPYRISALYLGTGAQAQAHIATTRSFDLPVLVEEAAEVDGDD
jgi:hypothetical protein